MNKLVAALSVAVLAACVKDKAGEYDSTKIDTAAVTTAKPAPPALTDANIAALLDEANAADSASGKIASIRGTSPDVKAFGVMMMNDHHALRKAGQDLVAKLGVTPVAPANDSFPAKGQKIADSLNATPKAAFDRTYIGEEIAVHQQVLDLIDSALGMAQNAELKDLLTKARPNIETHLKRAQDIQAKLGPAATP